MSVRNDRSDSEAIPPHMDTIATIGAAVDANSVHDEGNKFNTVNPDDPLRRTVSVNITATLGDLMRKKQMAQWMPTSEALQTIFRQKKFTDLKGSTESSGDLKSVVLHSIVMENASSTFPFAIGTQIPSVQNSTYSITGQSFSHVSPPNSVVNTARTLQEDDVSLAYEFARKFPGYTADNLTEKGIHIVDARNFALIAADHPLVTALEENATKLQTGEISMMPEGLVKISTGLYDTVMPMVHNQVRTQLKVHDLSNMRCVIEPTEFSSWSQARNSLMETRKCAMKSELESRLAKKDRELGTDARIRKEFEEKELQIESEVDNTPFTFHATLGYAYNFLSR